MTCGIAGALLVVVVLNVVGLRRAAGRA